MAATQKPILEKEIIILDSSSESEDDNKEEEEKKEGSQNRSMTKAEENKMLADLTAFPGLAAMFAAEANMRKKNKRRNQIRRIKKKLTKVDGGEARNNDIGREQLVPFESGTLQMLPVDGGEGRNDDLGTKQFVPSESGMVEMLPADDTEKEKIVNNCKAEDKTASESSCNGLQPPLDSGPRLTSSEGEKMTDGDSCCKVQVDPVATEVFLEEEKSNEEQDDVIHDKGKEKLVDSWRDTDTRMLVQTESVDRKHNMVLQNLLADDTEKEKIVNNCKPEDKTASESSGNGLQPPLEIGPHLASSEGEKMTGGDSSCKVQVDPVATEVFLGEEKSNEEQDDVIRDKGKEKLIDSCRGTDTRILVETESVDRKHNMVLQNLLADDTEKEKIVSNCKPEDNTASESSGNGLQPPLEIGPRLTSSEGEKMTGGDSCCKVQVDPVATEVFLGEEKRNEEQDDVGKEKLVDSCRDTHTRILVETESVDRKHNMVLQNLLRPLRYFSPPESRWITCHGCGEDNHSARKCMKQKRKRGCFICADPGHDWKQCKKVNSCFICNRRGHLAKDCPQKDVAKDPHSKSCLKCGDSGHDMFSCDNPYCSDDLEKIQCYVCKGFGHLCCIDYAVEGPRQVSCYTCGKSGHLGSDCKKFHKNANSSQLAASCDKQEERSYSAVQQMQYMQAGEQGNSSTLKKSAEQRDGALHVKSAPHMFFGQSRQIAQKQTVNARQGWPRRNNVWVRPQTQPQV